MKIRWPYLKNCWFITYDNPFNNGQRIILANDQRHGGVRFAEGEEPREFYDWDDVCTEVFEVREITEDGEEDLSVEEAKQILESWGQICYDTTVSMMIGIPGSGKSTFAKTLSGVYICPDEVRKELYGDISVQGNSKEVFSIVEKRIKDALQNGDDVIYDATNTTPYRKETIKEFHSYGATRVNGYFVDTPFEVCCERNRKRKDRSEPVPKDVMERMNKGIINNPPCKEDGFDSFVVVKRNF